MRLVRLLEALIKSLIQYSMDGKFMAYAYPNSEQLQYAGALGIECYWLQASYILLSPSETVHVCTCLLKARTHFDDATAV